MHTKNSILKFCISTIMLLCVSLCYSQFCYSEWWSIYDDSLFIFHNPDTYNCYTKEIKNNKVKKITKSEYLGEGIRITLNRQEERWYTPEGRLSVITSPKAVYSSVYTYDSSNHFQSSRYIKKDSSDSSTIVLYNYRADINRYEWEIYKNDSLLQQWKWSEAGDSGVNVDQNFLYAAIPEDPVSIRYISNEEYTLGYKIDNFDLTDFTAFSTHNISIETSTSATWQRIGIPISKTERRIYDLALKDKKGQPTGEVYITKHIYDKHGRLVKIYEGDEFIYTITYLSGHLPKSVIWTDAKNNNVLGECKYEYEFW